VFAKLLVPLGRSTPAERVFHTVTVLAGAFGSEVVLVDACRANDSEAIQTTRLRLDEKVRELGAGLAGSSAVLESEVIVGTAPRQILNYVEAGNFDLVVMSSNGRSGMLRWSLSDTVDRVLRRIGIPLIIVRAGGSTEESRVFSRIAVPLDGSTSSSAILPLVTALAEKVSCEIIVVRVVEPGMRVRTVGGLGYVPFHELGMDLGQAAGEYLEKVSAGLAATGARVNQEVRVGHAAQEVLALADEEGCTVIAMSSHEHSKVRTWAMGSVTARIVQGSSRTVWLAPSFARE